MHYGNPEQTKDIALQEMLKQYSQIITAAAQQLTLINREKGRTDVDYLPMAYQHVAKLQELGMNPNKDAAMEDVYNKMSSFMDKHYKDAAVYKEFKQVQDHYAKKVKVLVPEFKDEKPNYTVLYIFGGFILLGVTIHLATRNLYD